METLVYKLSVTKYSSSTSVYFFILSLWKKIQALSGSNSW
jgi:hypothetical protein